MGGGDLALFWKNKAAFHPYRNLISRLKEKGVDTNGPFFIDAANRLTVVNVANGLSQKRFVKDIMLRVDEAMQV